MKINDVIKKCIKIPGISIKQAEYSMELILNTKEGKGSMTFFSLFPGLSLAYIFINSPTWTAPDLRSDSSITKGPLLLNYCVTGRCEMILNNKKFCLHQRQRTFSHRMLRPKRICLSKAHL